MHEGEHALLVVDELANRILAGGKAAAILVEQLTHEANGRQQRGAKRTHAKLAGHVERLRAAACLPQTRVRLLYRARHAVALGNIEVSRGIAEQWLRPEAADDRERLANLGAGVFGVDAEGLPFLATGLGEAQFEAALAQNIQRRCALGYLIRVVDAEGSQHAGMPEMHAARAHGHRGEHHVGRR